MSKKKNKSKKTNDNGKSIGFLLCVALLFVIILISTIFSDLLQISANRKETEELTKRYNELLEEEASLNSEVVKLQDPKYIARYAREKYMYTKDGEKILKIIDGKIVLEDIKDND